MEFHSAWLLLYASIVSLNEHPGTGRGDSSKKTPQQCGALTDEYFTEYLKRVPLCLGQH